MCMRIEKMASTIDNINTPYGCETFPDFNYCGNSITVTRGHGQHARIQ